MKKTKFRSYLNIDRITSEALNVQFKILKEYIYYLMKSILIIEKNGFLHIFHMYCVSGRDWFKKVSDMEHFFLMKGVYTLPWIL